MAKACSLDSSFSCAECKPYDQFYECTQKIIYNVLTEERGSLKIRDKRRKATMVSWYEANLSKIR